MGLQAHPDRELPARCVEAIEGPSGPKAGVGSEQLRAVRASLVDPCDQFIAEAQHPSGGVRDPSRRRMCSTSPVSARLATNREITAHAGVAERGALPRGASGEERIDELQDSRRAPLEREGQGSAGTPEGQRRARRSGAAARQGQHRSAPAYHVDSLGSSFGRERSQRVAGALEDVSVLRSLLAVVREKRLLVGSTIRQPLRLRGDGCCACHFLPSFVIEGARDLKTRLGLKLTVYPDLRSGVAACVQSVLH